MELAIRGGYKLDLVQQCRLWLQVATLPDICIAEGDCIEDWAFNKQGRPSKIKWPQQGKPSQIAWREWRKFLRSLLSTYGQTAGRFLQHNYKMEAWSHTHQHWEWTGNE